MTSSASLPYVEADIVTILVIASFLILSDILGSALDKLLYCGIIGQILLGVAWGTPGSKWLSEATEATMVELGYLGLILMVYEGGLSTSFTSLRANLLLSTCVALTGISLPIVLSFVLTFLTSASYVQAFAAGAALCSTSLGTTLTLLSTTGLAHTRLGVVLTSAAMMDDVVGLVMVQIISSLGSVQDSIPAAIVLRPVLVSLAFAICVPILCRLVVKPTTEALNQTREQKPQGTINRVLSRTETALTTHIFLLLAFISTASLAGTSNLFAGYLAGASISWWDTEVSHVKLTAQQGIASNRSNFLRKEKTDTTDTSNGSRGIPMAARLTEQPSARDQQKFLVAEQLKTKTSGKAIYNTYFDPPVQRMLKPFFFGSIGFSIPINRMFSGTVVWKGLVYTILMILGKCICGIWLVRIPRPKLPSLKLPSTFRTTCSGVLKSQPAIERVERCPREEPLSENLAPAIGSHDWDSEQAQARDPDAIAVASPPGDNENVQRLEKPGMPGFHLTSPSPSKPISLYAPAILASAMVARGEIGFLISALAQGNGIFDDRLAVSSTDSEIFLVVTWAVVLCTLVGPLCVGGLVRRVKKLEQESFSKEGRTSEGRRDVLGVWGVQ
ncbi:hypothetical protein MMC10_004378 [Thelotrema lepadinum]|nr:hypothetical protein [Thelotrema lepadinum]